MTPRSAAGSETIGSPLELHLPRGDLVFDCDVLARPGLKELEKRIEEDLLRQGQTERERRKREAEAQFSPDIPGFERTLKERRKSLADIGPVLEFNIAGSLTIANIGCLIGETGNVYTYDLLTYAGFRTANAMSAGDFRKAVDLARSLDQQQLDPRRVRYDAGVVSWTVSLAGVKTVLKLAGEFEWTLPGDSRRIGEIDRPMVPARRDLLDPIDEPEWPASPQGLTRLRKSVD